MRSVLETAMLVKKHVYEIGLMTESEKNGILQQIASCLTKDGNIEEILRANAQDIAQCEDRPAHYLDRLRLTRERIAGMSEGVSQIARLADPIGEETDRFVTESGLKIRKVRVPLGVVGIIYEARPNVTTDAIALCVKSGNAVVLRGSREAYNTNCAIVNCIERSLAESGIPSEFIGLVEDTTREGAAAMMKLNDCINVLIPRGGGGLIRNVVENSTIPVIETGTGNCHIYVHEKADLKMATDILVNAKASRPSVCNAAESLLVDESICEQFLPEAKKALESCGVRILGCDKTKQIIGCDSASEEDYYTEFSDYIISVKVVEGLSEAVRHINTYGSKHSDCIVTSDLNAAQRFLNEVDAACVYHNASTRFTDGFMFGFGAEMGISTQKLHARGPMGLKELTSYKYEISGKGQIRL